jgi:sigma-B regulation protein RsbU (phosphoserine phosphatase)
VNAGHCPPLVLKGGADRVVLLEAKVIALGVMDGISLEEKEIVLAKNDVVIFYTDGVSEAINDKTEQFGQRRLARLIEENHDLSAQEIIKRIQQEVMAFSQGQPQFDNVTLMILKAV